MEPDDFAERVRAAQRQKSIAEDRYGAQVEQEEDEERRAQAEITRTAQLMARALTARSIEPTIQVGSVEVVRRGGMFRSNYCPEFRLSFEGWAFAYRVTESRNTDYQTAQITRLYTGYILDANGQVHRGLNLTLGGNSHSLEVNISERWGSSEFAGPIRFGYLRGIREEIIIGLANLAVEYEIDPSDLV